MNYKKYIKFLSIIILIFIGYHLLIWNFFTSKIFNLPDGYIVGDLGRMSYQINSLHLRKTYVDLNVSHTYKSNFDENRHYDIVTLGDSFFNGGGGGRNPYLQDYLVKDTNLSVLNILNFDPQQSPLFLIENLIKIGWFEKYEPKYFILESVERGLNGRFDLDKKFPLKNIQEANKKIISPGHALFTYVPKIKLINTANYKILYYDLMYLFKNHAQKDVYKLQLNKKLFSVKDNDVLLCYHEDIEHIHYFTNEKLIDINNKLNKIAKKLESVRVKLIFVIAVDKYDLYYSYIKHNKYPKNTFLERFEKIKNKHYIFINTKKILRPLLEKQTIDLFYADDTHWSYKANEAISKYISNIILNENKK